MTDAIEKAIEAMEAYLSAGHKEARREASVKAKVALQLLREHKAKQAEGVENTINKIMQEIKENTFVDAYDMSVITGILRQALTQGDGDD